MTKRNFAGNHGGADGDDIRRDDDDHWIPISEVAVVFGVSPITIRRWATQDENFPPLLSHTDGLRAPKFITRGDLRRYMAERRRIAEARAIERREQRLAVGSEAQTQ